MKPELPHPNSVLSGETSGDVLLKFDEWSHLIFIKTVLRSDKTFVKKVPYVKFKNRILKMYLNSSKIVYDLSVGSR